MLSSPYPLPWQSTLSCKQALTYFLSLYIPPILDISCEWNHPIYGLSWLTIFTCNNIFKVYSYCCKYLYFVTFYG